MVTVDPIWAEGALWVNREVLEQEDAYALVSKCLLYIFKFRKFTESRWMSTSDAARGIVASCLVGLQALVDRCNRTYPQGVKYHLQGFGQLTPGLLRGATLTALMGHVPEAMILELLEDDRVAKRLSLLEQAVQDEIAWLETLGPLVWSRCSHLLHGCPDPLGARVLRSDSITAALVTQSYIDFRVFSHARSLPWSLCRGDIAANLQSLQHSPTEPEDHLCQKLKELLQLGYSPKLLEDAVGLLQEVHWSTIQVEQAHGSVSSVHRLHPDYQVDRLVDRATLHQMRMLFRGGPGRRGQSQVQGA